MNFQPGDVAYLKSSGETVTVLAIAPEHSVSGFENWSAYKIRRPHNTKNGIVHALEVVLEIELETTYDHINRDTRELEMKIKSQHEILTPLIKELKKDKLKQEDFDSFGFANIKATQLN